MRPTYLRSGLAASVVAVCLVLLVLHGCQEPPDSGEPASAVAATQFPLSVTGTGAGGGVVTSSPAGISCSITAGVAAAAGCTFQFNSGTVVQLTATPQSGHSFVAWSSACTGRNTCSVTMTAARTATAKFLKGPFTTKVSGGTTAVGNGTVTSQAGLVPGLDCVITNGVVAATGCSAKYPAYTTLKLTATAAPGHAFQGWSAPCAAAGTGICQFDAIQPRTVTATFRPALALTVSGGGAGSGSVRSQAGLAPPIDCTITAGTAAAAGCGASYPSAAAVTLSAIPSAASAFAGWTGACTGTGPCQVTMSQATQVTAAFSLTATSVEAVDGRWEPLFSTPIVAVHMHVIPTGRILMWGLAGESQIWNPAGGGFTEVISPYEIFCSGHTFLPDGRLLVSGGHISNGVGLPLSALFDPVTSSWSTTTPMARGRWYPTTTTLPNGEILTLAGTDESGAMVLTPEIWNGTSWRQLTTASSIDLPYYPRVFVAPNGKVFMAGERPATRYLDVSGTGTWTYFQARKTGTRSYGSAVMYAPGKIVYMGGGDPPKSSAEVIDLNQSAPRWRLVAPMAFARRHLNATLLADGQVLVTHGTSGPGFNNEAAAVRQAELWNPSTETWTTLATEAVGRVYHSTALLLPDGRVLSSGSGDSDDAVDRNSAQIFTPPYLFRADGGLAARPAITTAPPALSYGQPFTVETPDPGSTLRGTLVRLSSVTHAFNESQLIYPLTFTTAGPTTLRATAPASGNLAPPGPYMLFLIDANGVPSVASILTVGP